jgi:hypothetical protein
MHVPRGVVAGSVAAVGAALITYAALDDHTASYRIGLVLLLVGLTGVVVVSNRRDTERLMTHQTRIASLSKRQAQQYTEMGWRAAKIDTVTASGTAEASEGRADVLPMPGPRNETYIRHGGSA